MQLRRQLLNPGPEGEIIRSSSGIKFGAGSIIHAGGGTGFGHSTAGGGAGGTDVQPLAPSINISPQAVVLNLRIAHPSICGPLGPRIPFVNFCDGRMALRQDLAGLPLAFGNLICPCGVLNCQPLAIAPALRCPRGSAERNPAGQRRHRVPLPPDQRARGARQGAHGATSPAAWR
nr:hypothetical protein [Achromobacter ruhlandii]